MSKCITSHKRSPEVSELISKVVKTLENGDFKLFLKICMKGEFQNCSGYCEIDDFEGNKIFINVYNEPIQTIIHEILHLIYPKYGEKRILIMEKQITKDIHIKEIKQIWKAVAKRL